MSLSERIARLPAHQRDQLLRRMRETREEKGAERPSAWAPIPRRGEGPIPLSFAQERLWFLDRLEPGSPAYHVFASLAVFGPLRTDLFAAAWGSLAGRHESLRTTFHEVAGQPRQEIAEVAAVAVPVIDLIALGEAAAEERGRLLMTEEARQLFDLETGPLFRVRLFRLTETSWRLTIVLHHIICDAWSAAILVRELAAAYEAFAAGAPPRLPALPVQYPDFASWQRGGGPSHEPGLAYWKSALEGLRALDLPLDRLRPPVQGTRGRSLWFDLPPDLAGRLRRLAAAEEATLFMVMLAGFQALLARWSGAEDLAVGSPIANRTRPELEGLIGFFVNTLVLRGNLAARPSGRELLGRVRATSLGAYEHQEVPFEKVVEALQSQRSLSRSPLFQVMLALQNVPLPELRLGEVRLTPFEVESGTAKFDLSLEWLEAPEGGLHGRLEFNTEIFDASTAARLVAQHRELLRGLCDAPEAGVWDLPVLPAWERQQLLTEWPATSLPFRAGQTLYEWFLEEAARHPDSVALASWEGCLSYGELSRMANRWGRFLRGLGVGTEARVGVCAERSLGMVEGILGVLAAGGAYLPLDPSYPPSRLAFMVEDAGVEVILTQEHLRGVLPAFSGCPGAVGLETMRSAVRLEAATDWPSGAVDSNLAYVIYTSGSTGRPKGVMVPHAGVLNLIADFISRLHLGPWSRVLQLSSLSFDVSVRDVFESLLSGGCLVLAKREGLLPGGGLEEILAREQITATTFPPSVLLSLGEVDVRALSSVTAGGEACPAELVDRFGPGRRFVNAYGPTETTVASVVAECFPRGGKPLIGRAVPNTELYVLDRDRVPVGLGWVGELYIGGVGVSRGYLGRPELTAERFVPDVWSGRAGSRLYRTGDLVRYRFEGELDFLGRVDDQVKVRGFRIELGEVEAALASHPEVRESAVVARPGADGGLRLVAYVVAREEIGVGIGELRTHLGTRLPEYMVPAAFVLLPSLPLTGAGKVDRRALPDPGGERPELGEAYVAPRGFLEEGLAGIWADLLGVERVGAGDGFFELGGHSLLATRVVSRVREMFGVEVPLRLLFEHPVLADLAAALVVKIGRSRGADGERETMDAPIAARSASAPAVLSFAQERLWFLCQFEGGLAAYNIPAVLQLTGRLEPELLRFSLREMARRQESLRTVFRSRSGRPEAVVLPDVDPGPSSVDLSCLPESSKEEEWRRLSGEEARRRFDLAAGPLLRSVLLRLSPEEGRLLLTVHHIVADGWSMGVLLRDLAEGYASLSRGIAWRAPAPPVQYGDYASWQRAWLSGEELRLQLEYWRERLSGLPELLDLPLDRPRPAVQGLVGRSRVLSLPGDLLSELRELGSREGVTLFMVLLAGFQALLGRWSGAEDLAVGSPIANRRRPELENLIGLFVNTLVLRGDLSGRPSGRELLARVRATSLGAYEHQDVPFEKVVETLQSRRSLSRSPLFQVMLALQNMPLPELRLGEVRLTPLAVESGTSKFDLTIEWLEAADGGLLGRLEYNTEIFDASTVARLGEPYLEWLRGLCRHPERGVWDLPILPSWERQQLLTEWPATGLPFRAGQTLYEWFLEEAARHPESLALASWEGNLSYGELSRTANRWGRLLRGLGVGPEVRVGVCAERSLAMFEGILGVLAAGGAYLPLDPSYPPSRLAFMVEDAGIEVVLTQEHLLPVLPALPAGARALCLETMRSTVRLEPAVNWPNGARDANLAYVIYTSGSTGRPKGVMVPHAGVLNLVENFISRLDLGSWSRVLLLSSISFDVSVKDLFASLLSGGCLVLSKREGLLPGGGLEAILAREQITTTTFPPSVLLALGEVDLRSLSSLTVGGEALPAEVVERFGGGRRLVNAYGPTETTVASVVADCSPGQGKPLIGWAVPNTELFVLDRSLEPVGLGWVGELYIGGVGVSRGYLGRPELTADRYLPDAWSGRSGSRLYRSGDLVRYRFEGELDFLGRVDDQVKVRGFRIELGEVEAALASHPGVRESVVLARPGTDGGLRLVAYVVGREGMAAEIGELRSYLGTRLPEYMVPAAFLTLAAFPLTGAGKVDRRALPDPGAERPDLGGEYVAPRGFLEEGLAGIWADLLGVTEVGAGDGFFELGGHSLLATRVVSRVREGFGVELPLRLLFEHPVLADLAQGIAAAMGGAPGAAAPHLHPLKAATEFPLSFGQERLWFLDQLTPGTAVYNIPSALHLRGRLDVTALHATLNSLIARHETLRTTFASNGEHPVQRIAPPGPVALPLADLGALPAALRDGELSRLIAEDANRPFDLFAGPLLRALLVRLASDEHAALFTLHHIISDGWSVGVLVQEIAALYGARLQGGAGGIGGIGGIGEIASLPPLPIQYRDFAVWQRAWLSGEVLAGQLAWWREQLAGAPGLLDLPLDRPRPSVQRFRGGRLPIELPRRLAEGVRNLGRRTETTPFMTLLAAFQALLSRLSAQADVTVGSPIAGRDRAELEGLIGFFVNTLALRLDLTGRPTFLTALERVRRSTLGAYEHQALPFDRLVEELQPKRDLSYAPLFQVMFALQNIPFIRLELPGLALSPLEMDVEIAKFDLSIALSEEGDVLTGGLGYNRDLFDLTTAARFGGHFQALLKAALADPGCPVAELPLLGTIERHQLLFEWSTDERVYPGSEILHELFVAQARRIPAEPAVWCAGEWMTYGELDARSDRLAGHLRALGVGPESLVGICLTRSFDLVVGVLAALKAGGAYVPLDPGLPAERLAYLIEDADLGALLIEAETAERLPASAVPALRPAEALATVASVAPPVGVLPENPAYVIYTSGSTGKPKGVMIPHRAITGRMRFACADDLGPGVRMIQKAALSFDVSVFEIFASLLSGGRLILPRPGGEGDPAYLLSLAEEHGVTRLSFPPTLLSLILAEETLPPLAALRLVLTGGETVPPDLPSRFHARLNASLQNRYGPTEATISVTSWRCLPGDAVGVRLPIGRPIPVSQIFLLDGAGQPVPMGVAGEIAIGGLCLARGYLGRPELTAERFLPNPYAGLTDEPGGRLYRTGDRARQRTDGAIEFLGRIDGQVKVRGFRVELGEIEAALLEHPGLKEAAVEDREDPTSGSRRLVAWVVSGPGSEVAVREVREFLQAKLPTYMVPAAILVLPRFPLTPSGKVDRRALPEPEAVEGGEEGAAGGAPQGQLEELLSGMWADLLGVARTIGREESFFELGGHSLLATRVISRVREALGVELPLRRLFETPTLRSFAAAVEVARAELARGDRAPAPPILPVPWEGRELPLSFAQERLWFLDQLQPGSASYLMPAAMRAAGQLAIPALAASLAEIVRRHAALRTTFAQVEGRPIQVIAPALAVPLPVVDLAKLAAARREAEALRLAGETARLPFDLAGGPLFRAALLRLGPEEHVALFFLHHIVSDGWSVGIFIRELAAAYSGFVSGIPAALPALPVQYADFALWQRAWLTGEVLAAEIAWWRRRLTGAPALLELPTDRPRPPVQRWHGGQLPFLLPAALSVGLTSFERRSGVTSFMLLLTAFQALLHRFSGERDIVVGSPIANRGHREVEGLIGFFVNTLALRGDLSGAPTFGELLAQVRETTLSAYAHQDLPFEKLVEALDPERSLAHSPIFQVVLSLQNAPVTALSLPGLTLSPLGIDTGTAKFDLTLSLAATGAGLAGGWEYDRDLFDEVTVARLTGHLESLLGGAIAAPDRPLASLALLTAGERAQLLVEWTATAAPFRRGQTLYDWFVEQATATPEALAAVSAAGALSYGELLRMANRWGRYLRRLGVGPESRVAVCTERSLPLVEGVLGVLAAGGAYLPLDPSYPSARLAFMLEDAGVEVVLTEEHLLPNLPPTTALRVPLDRERQAARRESPADFASGVLPANLAYVIYTSGSTGRPKGVMVPHEGVLSLVADFISRLGLGPQSRILQLSSLSFDVSVRDLFESLLSGGCLVLAAREQLLPGVGLEQVLAREQITATTFPPSALLALADVPLPALATVTAGGEACPAELVDRWGVGRRFFNAYGPTETTVASVVAECRPGAGKPPIGRSLPNTELYVLDPDLQPVGLGWVGELWIGGTGVTRGYLGRPELTAERFVPDAWSGRPGDRVYRTGDLVRYRAAGELDFLGRADHQVKVRGFRIELGEIEAALAADPAVEQGAVTVREDRPGDPRLVAYIVPRQGTEERELIDRLRSRLEAQLPAYMVPSAFVALPALPLTPAGKVDRKALPAPDWRAGADYVAPRSPLEEFLVVIWGEVLHLERLGVQDNFFRLGGHSLLATQLIARVRAAFQVELPLRRLFESPTVESMAAAIETVETKPGQSQKLARVLLKARELTRRPVMSH